MSVLDSPPLPETEDQEALNLAVWERALEDEFLNSLPFRLESDRYGNIVMTPLTDPEHGAEQAEIGIRLHKSLPQGRVVVACPISTREGVKAADIAWISHARRKPQRGKVFFSHAPEICVEVKSPGNSMRELRDKRALYFKAGADEVWFCSLGVMDFFARDQPETAMARSILCPEFPAKIEWEQEE